MKRTLAFVGLAALFLCTSGPDAAGRGVGGYGGGPVGRPGPAFHPGPAVRTTTTVVGPGPRVGPAVATKTAVRTGPGPGGVAAKTTVVRPGVGGPAVATKTVVRPGPGVGPRPVGPVGQRFPGDVGVARAGVRVGPVGHYTTHVTNFDMRNRAVVVRNSFVGRPWFNRGWWGAHPVAWRPARWGWPVVWVPVTWGGIATFVGYPPQPVIYDYGTTVVYQGDQVYYNGDPVATAEDYTQQAAGIAARGRQAAPPEDDEWKSLGVFAAVQGDEKEANNVFQLAINKDGVIRGNYYNALTDTTLPVQGAVDKRTQRAAWTVGDRKDVVYETGIGNLTQDQTSMLIHFGDDRTQQVELVRLEQPKDEG